MWPEDIDVETVQEVLDESGGVVCARYVVKRGPRPIAALMTLADLRRLEMIERLFEPRDQEGPPDLLGMLAELSEEDVEALIASLAAARADTAPAGLEA